VEAEAEHVTLKQIAASSVISYYRLREKNARKKAGQGENRRVVSSIAE
jgi:hypothetical protein